MEKTTEKFIICEGNLSEGWRFHGLFDSFDEACEVCERMDSSFDTWVSSIEIHTTNVLSTEE